MVEVNCETDFVAKNEDFIEFARNIAMHIAATNPVSCLRKMSRGWLKRKWRFTGIRSAQSANPNRVIDKIAEGKLNKFYKESCLLNQAYVRNPNITVGRPAQ